MILQAFTCWGIHTIWAIMEIIRPSPCGGVFPVVAQRREEWAWYDKPCHLHHVGFVGRHFNETVFRNTCENALWGAKVRCQDSSIVPSVVVFPSCHQSCALEAKWPARVPGILSYTPPAPAVVWFGPFPSDLASSYLAFPHTGVWSPALVYLLTPTRVMEGPHHPKWCISDIGWGLWVHFYTLLECSPHSLFPFLSFLNERCEGSSLLGPTWPLPAKAGRSACGHKRGRAWDQCGFGPRHRRPSCVILPASSYTHPPLTRPEPVPGLTLYLTLGHVSTMWAHHFLVLRIARNVNERSGLERC